MISLDLFGEVKQNTITLQQRGELYMRIFRYMSEDFVNNQDMETFVIALISWIESVETRMQTLSQALMSHTHPITPHTHPVPPHTHSIPAHIHVACSTSLTSKGLRQAKTTSTSGSKLAAPP